MTPGAYILLAILIVVAVFFSVATWFVVFRVWPYFTDRNDRLRGDEEANQKQLLEVLGLHARTQRGTETALGQVVVAITYHTKAIEQLADRVQVPRRRPPVK